jgi:two-component system sensor histidine kinase/response regulator
MPSSADEPDPIKKLRRQAEEHVAVPGGSGFEPMGAVAKSRLVEELRLHQIELEMQNDELTSSRLELEVLLGNYTQLYDFAPVGYFTFDSKGSVLQVNLSGALLLGPDRSSLIGARFGLFLESSQRAIFSDFLVQVFSTSVTQSCDLVLSIPGQQEQLYLRLEALLSDDEKECRAVAVDISQLKKSERRYHALNAELEKTVHERTDRYRRAKAVAEDATHEKSRFLAMMSHEIRTPMNGVIGMADMLSLTPLSAPQQEMVQLIQESAGSLLDVINNVLDFSEVDAGKVNVTTAPVQLVELIEHVCSLLQGVAQQKSVELTLFIDPMVPETVIGDALRLRQVLINLLGNAIKFSSELDRVGHVHLQVNFRSKGTATGMLEMDIIDNGIGMDSKACEQALIPYSQADAPSKQPYGGSGLGLSICTSLLALMKGQLTVHSEVGVGSTFTVQLEMKEVASKTNGGPLPDVADLNCLVVGAGQANDFARYLQYDKAIVEQAPNLAATATWMSSTGSGVLVWLVDEAESPPSREKLMAIMESARIAGTQLTITLVLHGGRRRTAREVPPGVFTLDYNVLTRKRLLETVALSAGREVSLMEMEMAKPSPARSGSPIPIPATREEATAQGRLCLVAEDDPISGKVLKYQLENLGFVVDVACSGLAALDCWRSTTYSLLLTDLQMPVMDGFELVAQIRSEETGAQRVPIIALSAGSLPDQSQQALQSGADDFLCKPVLPADLAAMLGRWLKPAKSNG